MNLSTRLGFFFVFTLILSSCSGLNTETSTGQSVEEAKANAAIIERARSVLDDKVVAGQPPRDCGNIKIYQGFIIYPDEGNIKGPGYIYVTKAYGNQKHQVQLTNKNTGVSSSSAHISFNDGQGDMIVAFGLEIPEKEVATNLATYANRGFPTVSREQWLKYQQAATETLEEALDCVR